MSAVQQKDMIQVSVIIPVYNREQTIEKALKSIQAQTFPFWEAIVVDDGSTDNTCSIVSQMAKKDKRIHLIQHEQNLKAQAARNTGIRSAKGQWIAFLDSDDEYLPESIGKRLELAQTQNVPAVHSDGYIIRPGQDKELYHIPPLTGNIYKKVLESEGPIFQGLLVKKKALEAMGYLDENIKAYQEWETIIRLAKDNEFAFCAQPTFIYDYRCEDSMSRDSILNGEGYTQIVRKHASVIWKNLGMRGLAYHYTKISGWYKDGGDSIYALGYKGLSIICKCLSMSVIKTKLSLLFKKGN